MTASTTAPATADAGDAPTCTVGAWCESCGMAGPTIGTERLQVLEVAAAVGLFCMTLCHLCRPVVKRAGAPLMTPATLSRLIGRHLSHRRDLEPPARPERPETPETPESPR